MPPKFFQRRLHRFFTRNSILRGEQYFYDSLVMDTKITDGGAVATVHGTRDYSVSLDWSDFSGRIKAQCACPHYRGGRRCKHLWALILEIDETEGAPKRLERVPLKLEFGYSKLPVGVGLPVERRPGKNDKNTLADAHWRNAFKKMPHEKMRSSSWQRRHEAFVVLEPGQEEGSVKFKFFAAEMNVNESLGVPRPLMLPQNGDIHQNIDGPFQSIVKAILTLALGEMAGATGVSGYCRYQQDRSVRTLQLSSLKFLMPGLFESSRVFAHKDDFAKSRQGQNSLPLRGVQFRQLKLKVTECAQGYLLAAFIEAETYSGSAQTHSSVIPIQELRLFAGPNLFCHENRIGFVDLTEMETPWFDELSNGALLIPREDEEAFLEAIFNQTMKFDLPASLNWERIKVAPSAKLELQADRESGYDRYVVDLKFRYGSRKVSFWSSIAELPSAEDKRVYPRDRAEEDRVFAQLPLQLLSQRRQGENPTVHTQDLVEFVKAAIAVGLPVDVESKKIEEARDFQIFVTSGVDWFDVDGQAGFAGRWVKYPSILEAISRGERFVPLPDGSLGLINEQMTKRLEKLAAFAEKSGGNLRFSSSQGLILNSLLENEPNLKFDAKFKSLREKIKRFSGIEPSDPSKSFVGKLRKYQRDGLGWLEFLDSFGLGGILADDMGLGKTIQCLAFLEGRRIRKKRGSPSLLIAPKSLLENWRMEANKFTPELQVLVHAGNSRDGSESSLMENDLVVTTYHTMFRDIEILRGINWDCVIADEAQAIKNPEALISKSIKLLPANFRLAMTGTPIENSIQDLFSISDFVNPGFLKGKKRGAHLKLSNDAREALATAFKPVILRRAKAQVLKDLPEKTEQMISVELEPKQLKVYNELKRFYQSQLLKEVREKGVKKSQIQILAALTRLRQAALHPGLIDPGQSKSRSSKFDVVLEMLEEIVSEGHRVLIFSQFTSLLGLLKKELILRKIKFCYLDGRTTKRQAVVDEFKNSDYPVFLMSLKAGGVGLNLVEADYVFLLDPWWNPAIENQAIDRVHRIGQKRAVNAYRFIAKNTVEEKILELQNAKRGLAEEIIGQKSSAIRSLTAQDIENLFA